ncbi:VOC family protein [Streptomyces sp. NPDC004610]|uniref:VOC family protein n=1 Tax=unclassified Streptomyces TaxID=2593676 RepID=UPI0033A52183
MTLVRTGIVVLDCAEPEKLADFYRELLGAGEAEVSVDRVDLRGADGIRLAFRRDPTATPPSWPRPEDALQAHLEFLVDTADDMDAAERAIITLGGRILDAPSTPGPTEERLCADPAGHSFTLRHTPGA